MPEFYWRVVDIVRHELTDEAIVEFHDKVDDTLYQQNGVLVPRNASSDEIFARVNDRRAQLEAEADVVTPARPFAPVVAVTIPSDVAGQAFDADGKYAV